MVEVLFKVSFSGIFNFTIILFSEIHKIFLNFEFFDFLIFLKFSIFRNCQICFFSEFSKKIQFSEIFEFGKTLSFIKFSYIFNFPNFEKKIIFISSEIFRGGCPCANNKTCEDPNESCNCDKSDTKWLSDEGYYTDPHSLGIMNMYFLQQKNLEEESQGRITLGPLECVETSKKNEYLKIAAT